MKRPRLRSSRRTAFTLVEVLATLVLVAIILPVAMRGISMATAAASAARRQTEAAALAEARLAELRMTGGWKTADLSGDFGADWPGYRWQAEVADWDGSSLRQLSVTVNWTATGRPHELTLTTLVNSGSP